VLWDKLHMAMQIQCSFLLGGEIGTVKRYTSALSWKYIQQQSKDSVCGSVQWKQRRPASTLSYEMFEGWNSSELRVKIQLLSHREWTPSRIEIPVVTTTRTALLKFIIFASCTQTVFMGFYHITVKTNYFPNSTNYSFCEWLHSVLCEVELNI
jgi:hypothetical protein